MVRRYKEVFDPNHSQECICHRGPMNRGLEESPDGDFVDIEDYEELKKQLAKANERVAELEFKGSLAYSEETGFIDLNKFAIEKKIEALEFILGRVEPVTVSHVVKDHIVHRIKQLRKEQNL